MNVLLVVVEDATAGAFACYGNEIVATPCLDRLAASGVRFDRAYCQATGCNPSRSSFLTGLRPDTTGVYGNRDRMDERLPTGALSLPEIAAQRSGERIGIGKLFHHAYMAKRQLSSFDRLELCELPPGYSGASTGWVRPPDASPLPSPRFHYVSDPAVDRELSTLAAERERREATVAVGSPEWYAAVRPFRRLYSEQLGDSGRVEQAEPDGQRARLAAQLLRDLARTGEPFFLTLGLTATHTPLLAPKEYAERYDPAAMPLPPAPVADDRSVPPVARRFDRNFDLFDLYEQTPERVRRALAAYYACVNFVDTQIGIVLEELESTGLADDTIVIFCADHGFHLGEHGLWSKVTLFEQSTRVPLIVRVPGAAANGRPCAAIVELVDVVPTLVDLWKVRLPDGSPDLEGTSFAPLLARPDQPWKRAAFSVCQRSRSLLGRSARTRRYRYSQWGNHAAFELYDLAEDPWEQTNLVDDPEYAGVRRELAELLLSGYTDALPA